MTFQGCADASKGQGERHEYGTEPAWNEENQKKIKEWRQKGNTDDPGGG